MRCKQSFSILISIALFLFLWMETGFGQSNYRDYQQNDKRVVFHDDFNDNRNNWSDGGDHSKAWVENGYYHFDRTFNKEDKTSYVWKRIDPFHYQKDFEIEANIRIVRGSNHLSGLLFGYTDIDNNYKFGISSNEYYRIVHEEEGEWNSIKSWIKSDLVYEAGTDFNKITVRRVGDEMFYFLNEKLVHWDSLPKKLNNTIGFILNQHTYLLVDYITISHLDRIERKPMVSYSDYKENEKITVYSENFKSMNGWPGSSANGRFYVENGFYYVESIKEEYASAVKYLNIDDSQNIEVETRLQFVSGKQTNNHALLFGYKDEENFNQLSISGNDYYRISEYRNGNYRIHKNWTKSPLVKVKGLNKLTVRKIGEMNYYFINEELIYQEYSEPFFGNGYGFRVYDNSKIRLDYLKLSRLPDPEGLKLIISRNVEKRINKWQTKDEFETTEEYQQRVTVEKREQLVQKFTQEVIDSLGAARFSLDIRRADYDADNQTFKILFTEGNPIFLKVPKPEARRFDQNLGRIQFRNAQFGLSADEQFVLKSAEVVNPSNDKVYAFDSSKELSFSTADLAMNFDPINVDVQTGNSQQRIRTGTTKIEVGKADVDMNIPETAMSKPEAIAVVIGNRRYRGDTPDVDYAVNDAQTIKEYLIKTMGFKPGNIIYEENATKTRLEVLLGNDRTPGKLANYVKDGRSEIFFFYSGHGAPDPNTKTGYIIPVDGDPTALSISGYSLDVLYKNLAAINALSVQVVIDACFSGATGDGGMLIQNASPIGIQIENPAGQINNGLVITASSGSQVASWYPEKGHGLLTYFYLKGLQGAADLDGNGQVTSVELTQYLSDPTDGLPYWARRLHNREQTPQVFGGDGGKVIVQHN